MLHGGNQNVGGGQAASQSQPRLKGFRYFPRLAQTCQPKPRDQLSGKTNQAVNHPMLAPAPCTMGCGTLEIFNRQSVLDDVSCESFLKEEVAGALGLKQLYQTTL